jgi:hypothetical protein
MSRLNHQNVLFAVSKVFSRTTWGAQNPRDDSKTEKFVEPVLVVLVRKVVEDGIDLACSNLVSSSCSCSGWLLEL